MIYLLIYPLNDNLTKITDRLNNIKLTIDFTYELETNTLFFFDILQIDNNNKLECKFPHK